MIYDSVSKEFVDEEKIIFKTTRATEAVIKKLCKIKNLKKVISNSYY